MNDIEFVKIERASDAKDYMDFKFVIDVQNGYWAGAKYKFRVEIPVDYPHSSPVVTLQEKVRLMSLFDVQL